MAAMSITVLFLLLPLLVPVLAKNMFGHRVRPGEMAMHLAIVLLVSSFAWMVHLETGSTIYFVAGLLGAFVSSNVAFVAALGWPTYTAPRHQMRPR